MNPKQFLMLGGIVLVLVAVLGFVGLIGPTEDSVFGANWYFDIYENWAHLILGVVALIAAYTLKSANAQKWLVVLVGILALFFGVWSLLVSSSFGGATLQNPADTILHFVVGIWALCSAYMCNKRMA